MLSKLKSLFLTVGKVLLGQALGAVDPKVQIPVSGDTLVGIAQEVIKAELAGARLTLTGDQKRAIAAAAVEQILLRSPIAAHRTLTDPKAFEVSVNALVGNVADILQNFHADAVATADVR